MTRAAAERITEERVRAAFQEARAAIAATLGFALDPALPLRIVDEEVLAERVSAENLPLIRLRQPDAARAEEEARQIGALLSKMAFAKYSWSSRELLVVPATWEDQARVLVRPELTGDATLRAVLVHELIHAWDDASHGLTGLLAGLDTLDAVMAMNAVIEGHAQFEARRVCERSGWTAGFDLLNATIGEVHESTEFLGETAQQALRIQAASLASAYRDGEHFIAALHAAGGDELVACAFREPPDDLGTILHPDWYLDPAQRPALLFDPEPALDLFAARFPKDGWNAQRMSLQTVQIEAALALLPPDQVRRVTESLRSSRALALQPSTDPTSKMVLLNVMEFRSEAAANDFVEAACTLAEIKDERMKQGSVRSVESERAELDEADLAGFRQRLVMQSGPLEFEVRAVEAARGPLVVETIFSAEPIEDEAHLALVRELFGAVRRLEGRPTPHRLLESERSGSARWARDAVPRSA